MESASDRRLAGEQTAPDGRVVVLSSMGNPTRLGNPPASAHHGSMQSFGLSGNCPWHLGWLGLVFPYIKGHGEC